MSQLVVLNLGKGSLQQGFPAAIAQFWQTDHAIPMQFTGALPSAPELDALYKRWQRLYEALSLGMQWRQNRTLQPEFELDEADVTQVSKVEFAQLCQELKQQLNRWLNADSFRNIDQKLRAHLALTDEIRLVITADSDPVLRLPWCLWQFFDDYARAELALSPPDFARSLQTPSNTPKRNIRILAVLGDRQGIDTAHDQALLKQLPHADLTFLVEPSRSQFTQALWESGWDMLFFAGHSSSQGEGQLQINPTETLTIDQLKYGLRKAIEQGLKLAIFNSCDGLGLARALADLHSPQVIVMREPVPDRVAQAFLKHFLAAFSQGRSLYLAVREAREKLQDLESDFPCATWLPVICQNPAELPPTWQDWRGKQATRFRLPTRADLQTILLSSVVMTGLVMGVRWLGFLQPAELWAFDHLMRLRPAEAPDPRLLVVTAHEADIAAQGNEPRRGSLSDRTLNRLLEKLETFQPAAIGLDLYRDFPADLPALAQRLKQSDRLFTLCKRPDPKDDPAGVLPPPEMPVARLGFSDFVEDEDGVLRRHLLLLSPNTASPCTPAQAFSVQLAFHYLHQHHIAAGFTPNNDLILGTHVFPHLTARTGGYQVVDTRGSQVLLNYRAMPSPRSLAPQVTLTQVLTDQLNPAVVKDHIVLIGVVTNTSGDYWSTPYGTAFAQQLPGVFVQAHMVSQLLSAAIDQRSLLWGWSQAGDSLWVGGWALIGGTLAWMFRRLLYRAIALSVALAMLTSLCLVLLLRGGWVPLLPALLTCLATSSQVGYLLSRPQKQL
ncbi:MAG: CHASE2 domain-containing protein [Leptolyngbya sp. BL-A-14]